MKLTAATKITKLYIIMFIIKELYGSLACILHVLCCFCAENFRYDVVATCNVLSCKEIYINVHTL